MISSVEHLKRALHSAGHSYTNTRAAVFQAIEMSGPISMHRLCAQLAQAADRASVYRTVTLYEKLGIVRRIQLGWKYQVELSEQYSSHHHHVQCVHCGKIIDFHEDESLTRRLHQIAKDLGITLTAHEIELQGVCFQCELQNNMDPSG